MVPQIRVWRGFGGERTSNFYNSVCCRCGSWIVDGTLKVCKVAVNVMLISMYKLFSTNCIRMITHV